MSRPNSRTVVTGVAVFVLLPLCIAFFMYMQMLSVLRNNMASQAAAQTEILEQLASQRISNRLEELERVAGYLKDGIVEESRMGYSANRLLSSGAGSVGILRLDGSPVDGQALSPAEYPAVQSAFRGKSAVRYRKGKGMLLTAPIYNGENIKYALYEFVGAEYLFSGFGVNCFDNQAHLMLADAEQEVLLPLCGDTILEDDPWFRRAEVQQALSSLWVKMDVGSSAAVYCETENEEVFLCVSELEQPSLYLLGIVPHSVLAGQLNTLSGTVLLVFGLLMALLIIGTIRVVSYDAKARESDELREAKQTAEEAYESKSRFLANMSHELRTPINTIMGMNEMTLRESREPDTRERAMDIKSASQILLGLINDVLDFSKIESQMLNILPVEYSLSALIRDLNLLSENRARSKSLDFELDIQPDLPEGLLGDDIRIQQVLTNLLTNAVKYTQKGTVTLHMSGRRTDQDTLILHCAVEDTGIGLRPEDIGKLMKLTPYTRVDEMHNRQVEGSGLGLSIIINLLKLMDSDLKVDSVYGKGSTFWFDLKQKIVDDVPVGDIYKRLEQGTKDYEYRVACYAPSARVMVVDDNSMNRKIFVNLLKQTKIQVTSVSSGAKCLKLVQEEHFDLIFMDHLMPDMDGVETLHHLKEMENNLCKDTPVIALTANAFSSAKEKYLSLGFDAFLAKPIITEKLEGLLVEMLPPECLEPPPSEPIRPKEGPVQSGGELPDIEGVDWDFALLHIHDTGLVWDALVDFYQSLDEESKAIGALAEGADNEAGLATYRTRVHALKSTAAMVGILSVSELARLLEYAARAGETEKIRTLTPILLELVDKTRERLKPFMPQEVEKRPMADLSRLASLLEMLRTALEDMDISIADGVMEQINHFSYEPDLQELVDQLSKLISALDFDGAGEVAGKLLAAADTFS